MPVIQEVAQNTEAVIIILPFIIWFYLYILPTLPNSEFLGDSLHRHSSESCGVVSHLFPADWASARGAQIVSDGNSCQKRQERRETGMGQGGRLLCVSSRPSETESIAHALYCEVLSYSSDIKPPP